MTMRYRFVAGQAREVPIAVQDQGRGISENDLPHVFDRFYRADKQRNDPQARESLGLGLYITAEIVKRHGGTHLGRKSAWGRKYLLCLSAAGEASARVPTSCCLWEGDAKSVWLEASFDLFQIMYIIIDT